MERLGIRRGDYVVKVNNRKVLDGVLEAIGLGGEENAGRRLTVLRAIDKLDKFGPEGVLLLLGEGRKDESGDFTKGAGLDGLQIEQILAVILHQPKVATGPSGRINDNSRMSAGFIELDEIERLCKAAGYGSDRIKRDPSVVRGLEYYTGPVYEVELTFSIQNEDGQVVRFGSVAGGGRYDGLVGRFRPEPVPATGFSIGVSRLFDALKRIDSPLVEARADLPLVVVTAMDNKTPEHMASYQALVARLRALSAGGSPVLRADLYLGSSGFNAQMKYADRRGAMVAVIQGSDERAAGTVVIKDLVAGAELAALGREGRDREDYLARQAEAQFAVPLAEFEQAVLKVINRHR
jgi:histidyl-tRNA synthetase